MRLVIDNAKLETVLHGPGGAAEIALLQRADRLVAAARKQIRDTTKSSYSGGKNKPCLESSIVKRVLPNGWVSVISDTSPCSPDRKSYSLFVHEGTKPHEIRPKDPEGFLAFRWPNGPDGDKVYFFKKVNHPGTAPNRFFTDNLEVIQ